MGLAVRHKCIEDEAELNHWRPKPTWEQANVSICVMYMKLVRKIIAESVGTILKSEKEFV